MKTLPKENTFYNAIADFYDDMTRFQDRIESEMTVIKKWQSRYGFASALDAACGTGLHAILLSQSGVQTTAMDISDQMLVKAREHAENAGVKLELVQASMQNVNSVIHKKFDAIFCLGNSIPHLSDTKELKTVLENFHDVLNPDGHVILQLLNYDKILSLQERIVGIHRQGDREFIRFYDFLQHSIRFNILVIQWMGNRPKHFLSSAVLYPFTVIELEALLTAAGFTHQEFFGDMNFVPFEKDRSANLVIVAS